MFYMKIYDNICRVLQQYTSVNNANMYTISNSENNGEIGIKRDGEVIVVIGLDDNPYKIIPRSILNTKQQKYPLLKVLCFTDGNMFVYYDYQKQIAEMCEFGKMMDYLIMIVKQPLITRQTIRRNHITPLINSISSLMLLTGIETFQIRRKDLVVFDDHRTTLDVIFEAHKLGLFNGTVPNLITFDYHEDCCPVLKKSQLLTKIGVQDVLKATSKQFWEFVEFELGKNDDDWISAAQELNLIKDVIIIGNEANNNVDNSEIILGEDGIEHRRFSIPHLSFSLGNRGCLGDSMIDKEPYYKPIRDTMQYHNDAFDDDDLYPFILDFDLDCFSVDIKGHQMAWPEKIFREEFFDSPQVRNVMIELIKRATFITISREPGCCGGYGECHKILEMIDRYFFNGVLKTQTLK